MSTLPHHKIKRKLDVVQRILHNPFDFLLDIAVRAIVHLFIPIPLVAELVVEFKGIIASILLNAVLVVVVFIIFLANSFTNQHANANTNITIPIDGSFASTDVPAQNPLGGQGLSLVKITAGFMDPNYTFFGGVHTGVDFVPDDLYYQTNKTFKDTGDVVVYGTMNGTVNYYIDEYGSHTVEVVNPESTVKVIDMHLNKVFVRINNFRVS